MVVDADPAGEPAVGVVLVAQAVERAGRADALERRVQPQGDEDRRVDRRSATVALDGLDPSVERGQVEGLDEGPHQARPVVGRQEAPEIARAERDLVALRALESWSGPSLGLCWAGFRGREIEQLVHVRIVAASGRAGNPPAKRFTAS